MIRPFLTVVVLLCLETFCWAAPTTKHAWNTDVGNWQSASNWKAGTDGGSWSNTPVVPEAGNVVYINTYDVGSNITITLTDDVDLESGSIYFECGYFDLYSITINLNGHSLKAANIILGNPDVIRSMDVSLNIVGPGSFEATSSLVNNSSSRYSEVHVSDGASLIAADYENTGGDSAVVSFDADSESSISGINGSNTEIASTTWTGSVSTDWDSAGNWNNGIPGTATVVTIPNVTRKPSKTGNISIKSLVIQGGSSLTLTGSLTVSDVSSLYGSVNSDGDQIFTGEVTLAGNSVLDSGSSTVHFKSSVDGDGSNLTVSSGEVLFDGEVSSLQNLTVNGDVTLKADIQTSGNQSYTGVTTLGAAVSFITDGNVSFGTAGCTSSISVGSYSLTVTAQQISFYGENNFNSLNVDNSGITSSSSVLFEGGKLQTITSISAAGYNSSNKLTIGSTDSNFWKVYFPSIPSYTSFNYVEISKSESVNSAGTALRELGITPKAENVMDASSVNPSGGWFVHKYYWLGVQDSKWSNYQNWFYDEDGTVQAPVPSVTDGLSQVILKKGSGKNDVEFEGDSGISESTITLKSITINEENRLGLAGKLLEATGNGAGSVTNNGTIAVYGTQTSDVITVSGTGGTIVHGNSSVIEYYGDGPAYDVLAASSSSTQNTYKNLLLNMNNGSSITFNKKVSAKSINTNQEPGTASVSYSVNFEKDVVINDTGSSCTFGNYDSTGEIFDSVTVNLKGNFSAQVSDTVSFLGPVNVLTDDITLNSNKKILCADDFTVSVDKLSAECTELEIKKNFSVNEFALSGNLLLSTSVSVLNSAGALSISGDTVNTSGIITCSDTALFGGKYSGTGSLSLSSAVTTFTGVLDLSQTSVFTHNSGTVVVEKSGTNVLVCKTGSTVFNDLKIGSAASSNSVTAKNDFEVEGKLLVNKPFTAEGITFSGAASELETVKTLTVSNLTVGTGSVLSLSGASAITVLENISNGGTFNAGSSVIKISGTNETEISGVINFYDLECSKAGKIIKFESGKTQSVTHKFTITGEASSPEDYSKFITLNSTSDGSMWNLDCTGATVVVKYAKIKDSNNISKKSDDPLADWILEAKYSWDEGNNINWNFPGMLYTWKGTTSDVWYLNTNWYPTSIPGTDSRVYIPDVSAASGGSGNFPVMDADVSVLQFEVAEASYVDLAGKNLTVTGTDSESYKNSGTVKSAGSETVTLPSALGAVVEDGVWEYYAGTVKAISNLLYKNVLVSDSVLIEGTVKASKFTVDTDGTITCSSDAEIDSPVEITEVPISYNFDNGGYSLTFKKAITSDISSGGNYPLNLCGSGTTSLNADVSVYEILSDSDLKIAGVKIISSENQNYNNPVVLSSLTASAVFKSETAGSEICFNSTVTGSGKSVEFGSQDASFQNRTAVFKNNVSGVLNIISYYPLKFDTAAAGFSVQTTAGILLYQDSALEGSNTLTFNTKIDSGSADSKNGFTFGTSLVPANVVFNRLLGFSVPLSFMKVYGNVSFAAAVSGNQKSAVTLLNQYYYGTVEAAVDSVLEAGGDVQIAGDITGSGSLNILSDTYISNECEIQVPSFIVGATGAEKNLHVSAVLSGVIKNIDFSKPVSVFGNAIFYAGNINVSDTLSVSKDLIILGNAYKIDDDASGASGVSGLFAYNHALRTASNGYSEVSYSDSFKVEHPDSTAIPDGSAISLFGATVTVAPGKTITIGKNFYANGTVLSGSGDWSLVIPDNDIQTSAFAEIYNSTINYCNVSGSFTSSNGWLCASENCTGSNNVQVDFTYPLIKEAYTVFDDVIYVSFKDSQTGNAKLIENSNNEINKAVSKIFNSAGSYTKAFMDADCTQSVDGQGDISDFYLRYGDGTDTSKKWNTDADGISSGNGQSTDRSGLHHAVIPYINVPKALNDLYASLRDCHKARLGHYYSAVPDTSSKNSLTGKTYTDVSDKSAPVLIAVKTGQEKHVAPDDASGQKTYDGHNFIEYTYSEGVKISSLIDASTSINVQATSALGGISNTTHGFTAAGLATFASGSVKTGKVTAGSGSEDNVSVHSLYRVFDSSGTYETHKIRLGIASYADGTVITDAGSINYWPGYITSAVMPSGIVTRIANSFIKDLSDAENVLEHSSALHNTNHALMTITVNSSLPSPAGIYGAWDVSRPVFAPYNSKVTGESDFCEAVGYTDNPSSPYLDRIEFHMVDSESMLETYKWFTKVGWALNVNAAVEVPAKDTAGGAKPFDSVFADRTAGGIRYSTLYNKVSHFKYSVVEGVSDRSFVGNAVGKTSSSLFISASGGNPSVDDYDSLYFALKLTDNDLSLKTTFEIAYDGNGYITDLAGNLLLPGVNTVIKSIDRVAPNFNISVASVKTNSVSGDELFIVFSKALQLGNFQIKKNGQPDQTMTGLEAIPNCLRIVEIDSSTSSVTVSSDLQIDSSVPARKVFVNKDYTGLILKLNREVTLSDMEKYYIQCFVTEQSIDPVSGTDAYVTYVQDELGNYMGQNFAHALTDFAVGVVNPLYAYDSSLLNSGAKQGQIYEDGSWAVHDWSRNQQNYGSLAYGYDIFMSAKLNDGSSDGVSELPSHIALYLAPVSKISSEALSNKVNKNTGMNWRMWFPDKTVDGASWPVFDAVSEVCNTSYGMLALEVNSSEPSLLDFTFDDLKFDPFIKNNVGVSGTDQVLFMFGLQKDSAGTPVTICHAPEYNEGTGNYSMTQMPLFAARLENPSDITSLDLWSIRLKDIITQRGNVTILNNVINASKGELTTVKVNMPSEGNLNVIVMTLDGNIVQYLQHGRASSGEHNYVWNGTTKTGKKVARGMYFVRVFGNGIDETRKVMVVKD